jgi:hypothetical protein
MSREDVARLLGEARSLREGMARPEPDASSVAHHDLEHVRNSLKTDLPIRRVTHCAELWLIIAADQLFGLSLMIEDGTTVFSLFPVLRSVIEHSAFAIWVLDDMASTRERSARAAVAVIRGQEEVVKAASRMGDKNSPTAVEAKAKLNELRQQATAEFGTLIVSPLSIDGTTVPRPSDIISMFGERWGSSRQWEGIYDWLCGTANHPSLNGDEFFDTSVPAKPFAYISSDLLNRLLRAALVPYLKALEYFVAYMGWESSGIDTYIDRVNATLGTVLGGAGQDSDV